MFTNFSLTNAIASHTPRIIAGVMINVMGLLDAIRGVHMLRKRVLAWAGGRLRSERFVRTRLLRSRCDGSIFRVLAMICAMVLGAPSFENPAGDSRLDFRLDELVEDRSQLLAKICNMRESRQFKRLQRFLGRQNKIFKRWLGGRHLEILHIVSPRHIAGEGVEPAW